MSGAHSLSPHESRAASRTGLTPSGLSQPRSQQDEEAVEREIMREPTAEPLQRETQEGHQLSQARKKLEAIRVMYEDPRSDTDPSLPSLPSDLLTLRGRVGHFASRGMLEVSDIVDCGRRPGELYPRYAIRAALQKPLMETVRRMQLALTSLTSYIPEKTSTHQIDPNKTFSSVLENATDLEELQVAWLALTNRLRQAPGFYEKYWQAALRALGDFEAETVSQPPSTPSTIYRRLDSIEDPHVRLKTALGALPSAAPWDPNPARDASRYLTAEWAEVHSLKSEIRRAFPPREPEESPELVFYDAAGKQKRRPPRTTYDNPLDFSPVDQSQGQSTYRPMEETGYTKLLAPRRTGCLLLPGEERDPLRTVAGLRAIPLLDHFHCRGLEEGSGREDLERPGAMVLEEGEEETN
ncbi:hypothetical protein HDZ31DRAFT_65755 [Schizophyllum fasciatum]